MAGVSQVQQACSRMWSWVALAALIFLALSGTVPAWCQDLPTVKVFATGGTIANTPDGRVSVDAIIEALPEVLDIANLEIEDIRRIASQHLTWQDFIDTAEAIQRTNDEEPDVDGYMVTIGSNAAEDIAYFLNLVVKTSKPIVVTAAQRARNTLSEDASRNFIDALITAATPEAGGKGAMVVANELIHPAREVTKNVVSRVDTWESLDTGALGIISGGEAYFYRAPLRLHTMDSMFDIANITAEDLPGTEILYSYTEASPTMVYDAVNNAGAQGLVIAAYSTASPSLSQVDPLLEVAENGTLIVMGNRGSSGRVGSRGEPYISPDNLTPQKANTLLKLALTVTSDREEVQQIFKEY
eukprot:jgi/Pico_ML_1/50988/g2098.t1